MAQAVAQYPAEVFTADGSKIVENGLLQYQPGGIGVGATPLQIRSFAFTYQTASLATGVTICAPAVGDVIYDIGVGITTAFNGTTPKIDVGYFTSTTGLFKQLAGNPVDATKVYGNVTSNTGLKTANANLWLSEAAIANTNVSSQIIVTTSSNLVVVCTQDGTNTGSAPAGSAGVATIYVVTGTPLSY